MDVLKDGWWLDGGSVWDAGLPHCGACGASWEMFAAVGATDVGLTGLCECDVVRRLSGGGGPTEGLQVPGTASIDVVAG